MKLAFTLSALPLLASANPVVLDSRDADKTCSIIGLAVVNCRAGPSRDYRIVRAAQPEQRLGIQCIRDGEAIDGEKYA